jgi:hypothetical protein
MTASAFPYVPQARPAPVDDRLLCRLILVAEDARHGNTTESEAEWLLSVAGPLLKELAARRAFMGSMQAVQAGGNIVFLPAQAAR